MKRTYNTAFGGQSGHGTLHTPQLQKAAHNESQPMKPGTFSNLKNVDGPVKKREDGIIRKRLPKNLAPATAGGSPPAASKYIDVS